MKKTLLLFCLLVSGFLLKAQQLDKAGALQLVTKNIKAAGLSDDDLKNALVSNAYTDNSTGLDMVYLQQSFRGLPVYNQIQVMAFKNGELVSNAGGRLRKITELAATSSPEPSVAAEIAVMTAVAAKKIIAKQSPVPVTIIPGKKFDFGKLGIANENITAELMWVPLADGKEVRLAWQVYLVPSISSDYWMLRIDANSNKLIDESNLTVYCNWNPAKKGMYTHQNTGENHQHGIGELFDFTKYSNAGERTESSPMIVNSASYKVVPFPAESPRHPGGVPAVVTDPWNAAPGNATSLKWHSNGTTDYNITRGNNVWAKEDLAGNNSNNGQPATSTTGPDPLTFNFTPDFSKNPTQTSPVPNRQFNITNLFYWINLYHDILYQYGFDEPAGNFQANNQGRGGAGNDFVFGDAQDGNFAVGSQSNANFATPADGGSGRMQMYLWDTAVTLFVNTPASISRYYTATESGFSTQNKLINIGTVTGQVVYYNDQAATTHEACVAPSNPSALAGKIALINRGNCNFTVKVKNAQLAGAIGVIMVNNVTGPNVTMAGSDNTITIPAVFISQMDGGFFAAQLANNLNVTLYAANIDGDVDNGVIMHEHTHGLSNRLTGGPAQASCLNNAEQMGEGWSDYYSLMITQNWATSNLATGEEVPRAIGTYAIGQTPGGTGIRTQLYCTDMAINNLVYGTSIPAAPHDRGEIWCATLWDMTWNIINQVGTINPNIYNVAGGGGNTIAMKLVTEGMKLQPCSPGFIDGRDAILQADQLLYGGAYRCAIKQAFKRRGMGDNASQGSSNNTDDQTTDFVNAVCTASCTSVTTTTQPANAVTCTGGAASFSVTAGGTNPTYQWQVSTNGGTTFTNIAGQTTATLNLTNVTAAMNNNQYQVIVSNTCPSTVTSTAAILTVNTAAAITNQPSNISACSGSNANFSVTATGSTNTYQWQVSTDGGTTFTNIAGATNPTLNLTGVTAAMNGNQYRVIISSCGPTGLTSSAVTLTVNSPAAISAQPANTSACSGGGDATFNVTATGNSLTYQWQVSTNGGTTFTNIPGATAATLTVTGITSAMNNNLYQVIITNPCSANLSSSQASLTVSDPASITTQPTGSTVCEGANTSFTIATAGTAVTYQWQVSTDGGVTFTNISGATNATLNLNAVTASMNNNQYHVQVFSCSPAGISSNNVTLTVNNQVAVTTQPVNTNACVGNDATISVAANGTSNTYQWQVSTNGGTTFTDIPGANGTSLLITGVTSAMDNNIYHVVISNACTPAAVTSANATLTVSNAASITTQPVNGSACEGANAQFTATATGSSYQWQVSTNGGTSFTDIAGATTTTLTLNAVTASMNNNQYQLVIGSCGAASITTSQVTLTVNSAAAITTQPSNTSVCTGSDASFTISASGTSPSYQWSVSTDGGATFTPITGATNATLNLTGVTDAMNNNLYQVSVSNLCTPGVTSTSGSLTVNPAGTITLQPVNVSTCEAGSATFSASSSITTGATYQWQVSTDGGTTFTNIAGETGSSLTLSSVTGSMNDNVYHVLVSACGNLTSDNAVLTVNTLPVVVITASPYINITEDLTTILTATATPPSTSFNWFKNGVQVPGVTSATLTVTHNELGAYNASVTNDVTGCTNSSNIITIADSSVGVAFIYPNPNNGFFYVRFPGIEFNNQPRLITMYDSKGARVLQQSYAIVSPNQVLEVHAEKFSKGTYALVLTDASGNTLGTGKVVIQ